MYTRLLHSLNRLHPRAWDFIQLSRMDKPIGIYLLLWPTLCLFALMGALATALWVWSGRDDSLATVLRQAYWLDVNEDQIIKGMLAHADQDLVRTQGFSMLDMKRYVESIGMRAREFIWHYGASFHSS